jgi:hypothetical protein
VALFTRRTEEEKALASARSDLATAQKKRATLAAREDAAATSTDKYALWCSERDATDNDIARLTKLVAARENSLQEAARAAAEAEARQKVEACRAENALVTERFRTDGVKFITELLKLTRDAAAAAAEAQRLNASLPPGVEPIKIGDFAARDLPTVLREVIATEDQLLWVNASGVPVGDQDAVVEGEDGTGTLQINRATQIICTKRKFRSTTFRPAFTPDPAGFFFSQLRLPFPDRPGVAFDGAYMTLQTVAAIDVEPPPAPKLAPPSIRTELVPLDPWPPAGAVHGEASRNVVA